MRKTITHCALDSDAVTRAALDRPRSERGALSTVVTRRRRRRKTSASSSLWGRLHLDKKCYESLFGTLLAIRDDGAGVEAVKRGKEDVLDLSKHDGVPADFHHTVAATEVQEHSTCELLKEEQ
jgi:hypothetical protein